MFVTKRLHAHYQELQKNPESFCHAEPKDLDENITHWIGHIDGPDNTPFQGGRFHLTIDFPSSYPFKPPEVRFTIPIFHPNISIKGEICLDILHSQWSPALTVRALLISLCSLLSDPNTDHGLNQEALHLYRTDPKQYHDMARQWTRTHAMDGRSLH